MPSEIIQLPQNGGNQNGGATILPVAGNGGGIVTYNGNEYELTNDIELGVEVSFNNSTNEVTVYGFAQSHIVH